MELVARLKRAPRELALFALASLVLGVAYSMYDSVFNNFLNQRFSLTGFQRSFLEFPRELPGFLVVFVAALLWFLCSRRLGALSLLLGAVGAVLVGFLSGNFAVMAVWVFLYSMGQHLFMPIASTIGMELAREGQAGRRLGQINSIRNFAAILGSLAVMLGFKFLGLTFRITFLIAALLLLVAAGLMFLMTPERAGSSRMFLQLHKEYKLFYLLNVISGARKQLFITFAPWVLVQVLHQPTEIMATLYLIGGVIGIGFQPLLGLAVDRLGERFVLSAEAVILVLVCAGYGLAGSMFPESIAFLVVCACFLVDQMIFSVSMARATYIKKIALQPDHVQPALTAAVTIDHVFSISAALLGGVIWNKFGYQYVFLLGAGIAVINFFTAMRVRVPEKAKA
jgi:predicted MFS family arabinose efflux permease